MLGGETIIGNEHTGLRRGRQGAGVRLVSERRPKHVCAAMQIQHRRLWSIGRGRDQRRHPTGCDRPHARAGWPLKLGLETFEHCPGLVQAGIPGDESGQWLEQPGDAPEQLSSDRQGRRHRLVDIAQQLAGSLEQRFPGERELHAMGRSPQQLAAHELFQPADLPAQRRLRDV